MNDLSINRKYSPTTFEHGVLTNAVQTIFQQKGIDFEEIWINAEYKMEGIVQKKKINITEVNDITYIGEQLKMLSFHHNSLYLSFLNYFGYVDLCIKTSSGDLDFLKSSLSLLEKQLTLENFDPYDDSKIVVNDQLIRKLLDEGKRLVDEDNG